MRLAAFATAIIVYGIAVSSCNGPAPTTLPAFVPQRLTAGATQRGDAARQSQITFTFTTVDDIKSKVNAVTGINNSSEISGEIGSGSVSDPYQGYTSASPYSQFTLLRYTGAQGTFITSLSSNATNQIVAGYVAVPPTLNGTWGSVYINGIWTLLKDRKGAKGAATLTEILGVNGASYAVGTYATTTGNNAAILIDIPAEEFTNLKTAGATNAAATGINSSNDIAGWETLTSGTVGFFERIGTYYTLSYPNAAVTKALALNAQDQLVGYYQKTGGGTKHGFLLTNPTKPAGQQVWQSIDEPSAPSGTVVTGVNDNDDICGYYVDSAGVQHGFVAVPATRS